MEQTSFKNPKDYPTKAFQMALPYTYDLHRLPTDISHKQRWMAEGRAAFEQATWLYAGTKLLQGLKGVSRAISSPTLMELTSTEYCYSGKAGMELAVKAERRSLSRFSISEYLSNMDNLSKEKIVTDLKRVGLNLKGQSPDGRFLEFIDRHGNLRVKIHPPDKITNYSHMHIYDSKGRSLNKHLQVVEKRSLGSHIPIPE